MVEEVGRTYVRLFVKEGMKSHDPDASKVGVIARTDQSELTCCELALQVFRPWRRTDAKMMS